MGATDTLQTRPVAGKIRDLFAMSEVDNTTSRRVRRGALHRRDGGFDRQHVDEHHCEGAEHQRLSGDAGGATVEAAFAIAALAVVLVACLAGVSAVSAQLRCVDSAREAARLAARGDSAGARVAAQRIAPGGARVELRDDGGFVVARVSVGSPVWLGGRITGEAVAMREPG